MKTGTATPFQRCILLRYPDRWLDLFAGRLVFRPGLFSACADRVVRMDVAGREDDTTQTDWVGHWIFRHFGR